jgi:hypothetical protein
MRTLLTEVWALILMEARSVMFAVRNGYIFVKSVFSSTSNVTVHPAFNLTAAERAKQASIMSFMNRVGYFLTSFQCCNIQP